MRRGRGTEDRGQRTEDGGRECFGVCGVLNPNGVAAPRDGRDTTYGERRVEGTEDGGRRTERLRTEDRGQRTEGGRQGVAERWQSCR